MTYTTEQLQGMSDHTINHALYAKLYYSSNVDLPAFCPDYCNNPNDIMPLAFERGISIMRTTDKWHACSNRYIGEGLHFFDDLPLRAIACLILMMDE